MEAEIAADLVAFICTRSDKQVNQALLSELRTGREHSKCSNILLKADAWMAIIESDDCDGRKRAPVFKGGFMAHQDLAQVARELARAHREADPYTLAIYWSPDPDDQEVRLVEVSSSVTDTNEVLPFKFPPRTEEGIRYASVLILMSPSEWDKLKLGKLKLPNGWYSPSKLTNLLESVA